ncbi:MAG: hypothetical protein JW919_07420 [Candidatus Omnitrophica bacterium]|nr:hypothetical protein [Candidatus Omnitrophota bacterium]
MKNKKKTYKRPELKGMSMLEAGAGAPLCCRVDTVACGNKAVRMGRGKGKNSWVVS